MATVRARYEKGVLMPLEPLDLEEGREVVVSVDEPQRSRGLLGIVERVKDVQDSMPPEAWDRLLTDGAKNKKHYLYGHPRVED